MSIAVSIQPPIGAPVVLSGTTDLVYGLDFSSDATVETVRYFRQAAAATKPRGGQLDGVSFTVEWQYGSHSQALGVVVAMRRTLRALAMQAPLTVLVSTQRPPLATWSYLNASIKAGKPRVVGIRVIQSFTITGALN